MAVDPPFFWGKMREVGGAPCWHPLADHCLDVAAVFLSLLELVTVRRRLAALGDLSDLVPVQCARLAWLAFLHDVGKLNLGFQRQTGGGHKVPAAALFVPPLQEVALRLLRWKEMGGWADQDTLANLVVASLSHHGTPLGFDQLADAPFRYSRLWEANDRLDPKAGLADLTARGAAALGDAFAAGGPALPATPAFQHGFAGLVSLADWIASDEQFFPYSQPDDRDRWHFSRGKAAEVLDAIGMCPDAARTALGHQGPFQAMGLPFSPSPAQRAVADLPIGSGPTVALLEAPTGSGKTEAALARYFQLFAAGAVDGMYFALPTRAAAVQIHRRIRDYVRNACGEAAPPVLLAVPGYVRVDEAEGRPLPGFEVQWPEGEDACRFGRGWAAENPKRYLAGAIAVGTIDQVLMAALRIRHAHLRGSALLRHLLVVDEVHASDPYMTALLRQILDLLERARGHALLMSATLGSSAQATLLGRPDMASVPPFQQAVARPYPALSLKVQGTMALESASPTPAGKEEAGAAAKAVAMVPVPAMADADQVARLALAAALDGGRVLVIRNSVRAAVATQQALESLAGEDGPLFRCKGLPAPHHSRFAREDRKLLDGEVEAAFGRGSSAPVVLVATQTVEQSLDIDADLLITDLCPADVLLQRIGRLHRHRRGRPKPFAAPRCLVLIPAEADLSPFLLRGANGLGFTRDRPQAYADLRSVEATRRLILRCPTWDLPAMNRLLVEEATHPERLLAISSELGWSSLQEKMTAIAFSQKWLAKNNGLRWDVPFGETGMFADGSERIATRLGADDRLVQFTDPPMGPFGDPVRLLTMPGWMAGGAGDAPPVIEAAAPLAFTWSGRRFVYDRLGLRPVE